MFGLGWPELLLIFVAVLLLFGAKRLPDIAQGMGKGIKEFRKAVKDTTKDLKESVEGDIAETPAPKPPEKSDDDKKKPEK
ncbi:MAG: twin-arginine translocase TatA/TatE family subunit [bacterium]